jgi:hypothetical protein
MEIMQTYVICPKHGEHPNSIVSSVKGHEGVWCQICWTDMLGESMPSTQKPVIFDQNDAST